MCVCVCMCDIHLESWNHNILTTGRMVCFQPGYFMVFFLYTKNSPLHICMKPEGVFPAEATCIQDPARNGRRMGTRWSPGTVCMRASKLFPSNGPGGSVVQDPPANAGDTASVLGQGRSDLSRDSSARSPSDRPRDNYAPEPQVLSP